MIAGVSMPVVPLGAKSTARMLARQRRQELAALYEVKADFEHRESMRLEDERQERRRMADDSEARHRDEQRRRELHESEQARARTAGQHDRQAKAMLALADAKRRSTRTVGIVVALLLAAYYGRDQLGAVLAQLGVTLPELPSTGAGALAATGAPSAQTVARLTAAVTSLVEGDDMAAVDLTLGSQLADVGELVQHTQAAVEGTNAALARTMLEEP